MFLYNYTQKGSSKIVKNDMYAVETTITRLSSVPHIIFDKLKGAVK